MTGPIEFGSLDKLLKAAKLGNKEKIQELGWVLAEYEHAKDATSPYDELGQIFCHHGVMELYDYTGIDNIEYIANLKNSVWEYLNFRMNSSLKDYMIKSMLNHAKSHNLAEKISVKWDFDMSEFETNIEGLAKYGSEGSIELIV